MKAEQRSMKESWIQLQLIFYDLTLIWEEFLPHARECWQLQREYLGAGNCHDWWKSRFYDFYIGHGVNNRRDFGAFNKFPVFWQQYGHLLQRGRI